MNKGLSVALLIVGVLLVVWGVSAFDSASSDVSQALTGSPTDKAIWLLVGGIIAGVIPTWPHSREWGYFPSGILGTVLLILLILMLLGRI